jgi:hypothetical protein
MDVLSHIAARIQTNIRELEGALIRVAAYASLTRNEPTVDMTQEVLSSVLPDSSEARVTADLVISVASDYFDLTPDEFRSPNRSRPLVNARQIAMYLCRELTELSLPAIGAKFGGRDHSTVLHATRKVAKQMRERVSVNKRAGDKPGMKTVHVENQDSTQESRTVTDLRQILVPSFPTAANRRLPALMPVIHGSHRLYYGYDKYISLREEEPFMSHTPDNFRVTNQIGGRTR